jgi:hypothetical protein
MVGMKRCRLQSAIVSSEEARLDAFVIRARRLSAHGLGLLPILFRRLQSGHYLRSLIAALVARSFSTDDAIWS